ncbi:hypothetical protein HG530_015086 [Fusarium avenaceum]|nr:hypothetical protein HG530_015086 [Fusarium avenaceum]
MSRTLALVTGSNSGIGLAVIKELAIKHNYHVLLGVRNTKAGEEIAADLRKDGYHASVVELDLASEDSVNKAVEHIEVNYGYLDVLINNAGVMLDWHQGVTTWDRFQKTFTTNIVGTGSLTVGLLPLLRKAKAGPPRIIFITSVMGSLEKATDTTTMYYNIDYKAYNASKAAVNMLMFNFARELDDVGGKVNSVCPGLVKTALVNYHEYGTTTEVGAERIVQLATNVQEPDAWLNYELQTISSLTPSGSSGLSLEIDGFTTDLDPMWDTITTDISENTSATDILFFEFNKDTQIQVQPQTLSSKGSLARVSNRLSSLQHASRVIMQMLYAYPQMVLRRQTFPPFIHPHWHEKRLPDTLATCMSIAQLFAARTPETEPFLWRTISAEEERFREQLYTMTPREVHMCLEVMIIYMMMAMRESGTEGKERTSRLFETTELIGSHFLDLAGSYSTSEQTEPSFTWEDWIFAESRRRMARLWLVISCVITIESGKICDGCSALDTLPLPSSRLLWEARSLEDWQTEKAFHDMSSPLTTLGELVRAKEDSGDPLHAQKLQTWETGSDQMAAMLTLAVEFVWGRVLQ